LDSFSISNLTPKSKALIIIALLLGLSIALIPQLRDVVLSSRFQWAIPITQAQTTYEMILNASHWANWTSNLKNFAWHEYNPDNLYSTVGAGKANTDIQYYGFNETSVYNDFPDPFPPINSTLQEVWLGFESYTTAPLNETMRLRAWNGTFWSNTILIDDYETETMVWYNFTIDPSLGTSLFPSWESFGNISTRQYFFTTDAGGCYTNINYFVSWNETASKAGKQPYLLKQITKGKKGDKILVYNRDDGIHWGELQEVIPHIGTWEIYDIFSGVVEIKWEAGKYDWLHHNQLTGNHPLTIKRNDEVITIRVDEILPTDLTPHIHHEPMKDGQIWVELKEHSITYEPIIKIETWKFEGNVYDLKTSNPLDKFFITTITPDEMTTLKTLEASGINLGAYIDPLREGKTTYYIDWFPVKAIYTIEAPTVCIPCLFVGMATFSIIIAVILVIAGKREKH